MNWGFVDSNALMVSDSHEKLPSVGWFGCIRKLSVWSIAVAFAAERGGRCGWFPVFPSGRNFHRPPATAVDFFRFFSGGCGRYHDSHATWTWRTLLNWWCRRKYRRLFLLPVPSACYWSVKRMEMVNRWRGQDNQWAVIGWKSDNQHFGYVTPFSGENSLHVRVNISFGRFQFWSRVASWVRSPTKSLHAAKNFGEHIKVNWRD